MDSYSWFVLVSLVVATVTFIIGAGISKARATAAAQIILDYLDRK